MGELVDVVIVVVVLCLVVVNVACPFAISEFLGVLVLSIVVMTVHSSQMFGQCPRMLK